MSNYTLEHTEQIEGFTIKFYTTPEESPPDWDMTDEECINLVSDIQAGTMNYYYFVAKVTAEKLDIELASDYLGGCCYRTIEEFIQDQYYKDMVNTVINEAKQKIKQLKELP